MSARLQAGKRLNDFVLEKIEEARVIGLAKTPFGMSIAGERLGAWQSLDQRYQLFSRYFGFAEFAPSNFIEITVPPTAGGARPGDEDEQPYFWNGMINEYVAEMAVWWAFDLLTRNESREFMDTHKPSVVFSYLEGRRRNEITVHYENGVWIVE